MKPTRVWQAILDGNRNIRFGDFERLLAAFDFGPIGRRAAIESGIIRHCASE